MVQLSMGKDEKKYFSSSSSLFLIFLISRHAFISITLFFLLIGFLAYFITIGLQSVQSLALISFCKQCELPFFIDSCRRFHGNAGTIVNRGKVYLARSVHLARQLTGKKAF